ncbi:MAG: hypothetical protein A3F12_00825 [Gammaproteobacteria bacterium RIFCSPHIGHO2_12_FULL_38_14]|nr:MAG: hypothetical protein A3F12_00825 [Gammaproteobacteria bacterium RIFCSPHIGHO2_12_FULL_38_14]
MIASTLLFIITIFSISLFLTHQYWKYALKKAILDIPNDRSSHKQPTPRGGGLVFFGIFMITALYLWRLGNIDTALFLSLLGGLPIAIIGYVDDIHPVSNRYRIVVHFFSAVWGCAWLGFVAHPTFIIMVLITVWFVNLYNFMDGIDGLAASETIFVGMVAGLILMARDINGVGLLCFALASSVLGFLVYNWEPAKLFMGDIGSGFLGYVLAILMWKSASFGVLPVLFWWILLGVFLTDATFTLLYRIRNKEKWYMAHRKHIYQRMVQKGLSHKRVTQFTFFVNILILLPVSLLFIESKSIAIELFCVVGAAGILSLAWFIAHKYYYTDG